MSSTEAKRDILSALTQLSLGRLLLSKARLRFTGRFQFDRSIAAVESKPDKIFFLPCHASKNLWSAFLTHTFFHRANYLIAMSAIRKSEYRHTQRAPLCWLLYVFGLFFLAAAYSMQNEPVLMWSFLLGALAMIILGAAFHQLTVADEGSCLLIRFGPLPLFKRRVPYEWMVSAQPGKTSLLQGLGIHWSFQGGWTWNLWGTDCVNLRLRNGILRIGSNDVPRLIAFLNSRILQNSVVHAEGH